MPERGLDNKGVGAVLREVALLLELDQTFPYCLYYFTGNLSHWKSMCERAMAMGFKLTEEGLRRNGRIIPCKKEEPFYIGF
jgi:DNA polymerase/3'-5' exonuclease PolX